MARGKIKEGRVSAELSDVIIAEWFRVLPDVDGQGILGMDVNALTAAFNSILGDDSPCQVILDVAGEPINIVVPRPPATTRDKLKDYLEKNGDFRQGMGAAVLFGCGR